MSWLLDTSVVSRFLEPTAERRHPALYARMFELSAAGDIAFTSVTIYEIERGIRRLELRGEGKSKRHAWGRIASLATPIAMDVPELKPWLSAATIWAQGAEKTPSIVIADADLLIVGAAVAHGLVLLTCDGKLFENCRRLGLSAHVELLDG